MLPIITAGRTGRRLGMIGYYNELFSLLNGFVVELLNVVQDVIVTLGRWLKDCEFEKKQVKCNPIQII